MIAFIPGFLISWLTFPGVIIHEFAHKKACEWRGIRVRDVTYFSLTGGGEVVHTRPCHYLDTYIISFAPFVVNTAIAAGLWVVASGAFIAQRWGISLAVAWLALSVGWHAIPSSGDANNVWRDAKNNWRRSIIAALGMPAAAFVYVANLLQFLWFDAIYSIAVGLAVLFGLGYAQKAVVALL